MLDHDDDFVVVDDDVCLFELIFFAEPVELLLYKGGKEKLKFFFVSQLRLLLLLNPQKDLEWCFFSLLVLTFKSSLTVSVPDWAKIHLGLLSFFILSTFEADGRGGNFVGLDFTKGVCFGRILPLEKSSSAEDDSNSRMLLVLNSKSEFESNNNVSMQVTSFWSWNSDRLWEKERRGGVLVSEHIISNKESKFKVDFQDSKTWYDESKEKIWSYFGKGNIKNMYQYLFKFQGDLKFFFLKKETR